MPSLLVPTSSHETEFTEKKSRFISRACRISDAAEARSIVRKLKEEFPDSRHVVWAFICGRERSVFGFSDDGEPHNTAGRPLFEVVKGSAFTDVLVAVIRYFGGVKLGTGGLVSAYTRAGQEVLAGLPSEELIDRVPFCFHVSYSLYEGIRRLVTEFNGEITNEEFGGDVAVSCSIPRVSSEDFIVSIKDRTGGAVLL